MPYWSCATDLQPHQQAAVTVLNLGGAARDLARELNPQELLAGGQVQTQAGPRMLDPMSYLTFHLQKRFAPSANETMLQAVAEMTSLHRNQGEH